MSMSQENVETVRRIFEGFQAAIDRGDPGAWIADTVPDDYEWIVPGEFAGRSVWRGREEFGEFVRTWTEDFEGWSIRVERLIDAGDDRVVALALQSAIGKNSGVPVEMNLGQIYELKDGRMVRVRNYFSHAEALEAAGLRE
jgi:ketosteroid isomerase-like protein